MAIVPFIKCSDISTSLKFYTEILDFTVRSAPDPDPISHGSKHALLEREGCFVHLSGHEGDGVFGNVNYLRVENIDSLYRIFEANGLNVTDIGGCPALRCGPVEQSGDIKEFWVNDPDGNVIYFGHPIG